MNNKIILSFVIVFSLVFCGCSCSKDELIKENELLMEEQKDLLQEAIQYQGINQIFDFYNTISTEVINSFVVVESKNVFNSTTLYSNGVVVANNGYYYYILTDNSAIKQDGIVNYRVMDANATVYNASEANVSDEESGLILLRVTAQNYNNVALKTITLNDKTDLVAYISSVKQINKIQLVENIKTSSIIHNDTSYNGYYFDDIVIESGSAMINTNNELCGMYLEKYNMFVDANLIRYVVYTIYSLIL